MLSCKKDEDSTLPSLSGALEINGIEAFISADAKSRTITLKPSGVEHPEGKGIGYYWKVSPVMSSYDTTRFENGLNKNGQQSDGSFTYTIKDSLGTYSIYCYAYASGYYGLSAAEYVTVVRGGIQASPDEPETSITGTEVAQNGTRLEGTDYFYVTTDDNVDWIANNIADKTKGTAFLKYDAMSGVFGRYYSYNEAKAVCEALPTNGGNAWRLPTDADWVNLVKSITTDVTEFKAEVHEDIYWDNDVNGKPSLAARLIADGYFNGDKLWEYWPEIGVPANTSGLAVLPVGYANLGITPAPKSKSAYPAALFEGAYEFAAFWTADQTEDNSDMAYYRYMYTKTPHLMIGKGYKESFGASVRCVREAN